MNLHPDEPQKTDLEPKDGPPAHPYTKAALIGIFGGMLSLAIPCGIVFSLAFFRHDNVLLERILPPAYGISALLGLPFIQGIVAAAFVGQYGVKLRYGTLTLLISFGDLLIGGVLFHEGFLCMLMALPLYFIIVPLGLLTGRLLRKMMKSSSLHSSLLPLMCVAVLYDAHFAPPFYENAISDAVTINAPPEYVWRYIVQHPVNTTPPQYWLWQIGMPSPTQSVASGMHVGAKRECKFTGNIQFDEEITELVPNKVLTFKVTKQPDHPEIIGHFSLDKGQMYLEANPDGTTTVIATSWYRLYVKPSSYFDWWAADIVRNVHFRVLGHIKDLAEKDRAANTTTVY